MTETAAEHRQEVEIDLVSMLDYKRRAHADAEKHRAEMASALADETRVVERLAAEVAIYERFVVEITALENGTAQKRAPDDRSCSSILRSRCDSASAVRCVPWMSYR